MPTWKDSVKRKNKALVTGAAGFAGSFLCERLIAAGFEVYGLLGPGEGTENIEAILRSIHIDRIDITHQNLIHRYIAEIKPNYIFHLAAMASVGQSIQKERMTYNINFFGSLNILEGTLAVKKNVKKVILIGSADSYGKFQPAGKNLKENQPFNPVSPYGISKAAAEYLGQYYFKQHRLPVVIARSFNHTGPRQSVNFAVPSFCRQIARIELGFDKPTIKVGNLSVKRDLSDVRDIAEGYYRLAIKGKPGEVYHFSSGRAISIRAVLETLLKLSTTKIMVAADKKRFRKSDIPILRGDCHKATRQLGWRRKFPLERTLKDTLNYWREKVSKETL
ncbi:NAD-dependent epimerase/dehydratase [Candidatus Zixiibacteriota bacterium]|nr:NAD-dependent epimerase/dehydratase [candidate division Zixibacteria bacterium]